VRISDTVGEVIRAAPLFLRISDTLRGVIRAAPLFVLSSDTFTMPLPAIPKRTSNAAPNPHAAATAAGRSRRLAMQMREDEHEASKGASLLDKADTWEFAVTETYMYTLQ